VPARRVQRNPLRPNVPASSLDWVKEPSCVNSQRVEGLRRDIRWPLWGFAWSWIAEPEETGDRHRQVGLKGFADPYRRFRDAERTVWCGPACQVVWGTPGQAWRLPDSQEGSGSNAPGPIRQTEGSAGARSGPAPLLLASEAVGKPVRETGQHACRSAPHSRRVRPARDGPPARDGRDGRFRNPPLQAIQRARRGFFRQPPTIPAL
jgi:hypothetical protein